MHKQLLNFFKNSLNFKKHIDHHSHTSPYAEEFISIEVHPGLYSLEESENLYNYVIIHFEISSSNNQIEASYWKYCSTKITFEHFFDMLPPKAKEEVIFNLDLFNGNKNEI